MRITEQMIDAFEDSAEVIGTYATHARDTADEVTITRADIYDGLVSVAPMIAEQAIAGYIEQGARIAEAEKLLRRVLDPERNEPVFRDIQTFLGLL